MAADSKKEVGRWSAVVVAIASLSLLTFQCWQADKRGKDLPTIPALIELGIATSALGVTIDAAAIGRLVQAFLGGAGSGTTKPPEQ